MIGEGNGDGRDLLELARRGAPGLHQARVSWGGVRAASKTMVRWGESTKQDHGEVG